MKLTVLKVLFGAIFLAVVVGAVWLLVAGLYGAAIVALVLAAMFGVFVVRDIRKALKE